MTSVMGSPKFYMPSPVGRRIKRHNIWSFNIASAITIGFGGSVGAEALIVSTVRQSVPISGVF